MPPAILAGGVYFAMVFLAGFVLGTLRTLVLLPHFGELGAIALEIPVMLAIAWLSCGFVVGRFAVPRETAARLAMGGVAFGLLMLAEMLFAWMLFERSLAVHLASYARPEALLGLAAQIAFGLFPLARLRAGVATRDGGSR